MNNEITTTDAELQAYEDQLKANSVQKFPAKYNTIKLGNNAEFPEVYGKFLRIKEGDTDWADIGEAFEGVILVKKHQYVYFNAKDKEDTMRTSQFDNYNAEVKVTYQGLKDTVKGISAWIKEKYPKGTERAATFQDVLYVLLDGEIYLLRVKGSACAPWFEYLNAKDPRDLIFSHTVKFGRVKAKSEKGKSYYQMTFSEGAKATDDQYKDYLKKAFGVEKMIVALENDNPNQTVEEQEQHPKIEQGDMPWENK